MKINTLRSKVVIVGLSIVLFSHIMYAATVVIVAVGTIPHSELFGGPATLTVRQHIIAPGEVLAWHYHPGRAYNVIKRGTLTVEDGCGGQEVLKAGQAFEETEFHIHRAKNLGSEEVEVYNTFVVPEGNPTTVNIPNNERRCGSLVPFLTLESNNLCIGSAWTLRANGVPNTSVNLLGTSSGKSWKISEWSKTDSSGTLSATGVFAAGTEGSHTLRVDIGSLLSNTISLVVSKCAP